MLKSTCAALSTAHGKAGIAVIRISGEDAFEIASAVFFPVSKEKIANLTPNMAVYGDILCKNEKIDTGLCVCFHAPHSYTGEDSVEISSHGSEVGVSLILSALFEAGAKPAEAGEFTKRAYLNGKLKLTQAEAVADLIDAESEASLRLSSAKIEGKLAHKLDDIAQKLTDILSSVYAYIDYPDEDLTDMSAEEMLGAMLQIQAELRKLISSYDTGRIISQGIPVAIVGSPNTGKSSFLNFLTGSERAIVTDIAGTTRDVITESITIGNLRLNLSDTAGIRDTLDVVEKIGVARSLREIENAELIFAVFDGSCELTQDDVLLIEKLKRLNQTVFIVINKSDLPYIINENSFSDFDTVIHFSAKTGDGYTYLAKQLQKRYPFGDSELRSGLILTSARQKAALNNALTAVEEAMKTLLHYTPDLAGTDLERAVAYLYETDGRSVSEEVVKGIFSRFCVGK